MSKVRLRPGLPCKAAAAVFAVMAAVLGLVGIWLYLAYRAPGTAMALAADWHGPWAAPAGSFPAADWLPSLLHPWAFGLASAALCPTRAAQLRACLGWGGVNLLFEAGQHPAWSAPLAQALHASGLPGADALGRYFAAGRFDVADLLAVLVGTLAACACVGLAARGPERHHA